LTQSGYFLGYDRDALYQGLKGAKGPAARSSKEQTDETFDLDSPGARAGNFRRQVEEQAVAIRSKQRLVRESRA